MGNHLVDGKRHRSPSRKHHGSRRREEISRFVACLSARGRATTTRAYSEVWQGASLDRTAVARALPSLLDMADELKAVAAKLGAPLSGLHLTNDASETTMKRTALADYRIVYFATHSLVGGGVKGVAEPAVALTPPRESTDTDDRLLMASEVALLKLSADWVVLSACNTPAGDKLGAEPLLGFARSIQPPPRIWPRGVVPPSANSTSMPR